MNLGETGRYQALLLYELQTKALEDIALLLEKNKIDFVPLKGSLLRKYYESPWMRECADIDIYVRPEAVDSVDLLLVKNGFQRQTRCSHHIMYVCPNGVLVELHFALVDSRMGERFTSLLDSSFAESLFCDVPEQTAEYYLYHLVHMLSHFLDGGCGKKFFADLWLLNHSVIQGLLQDAQYRKQKERLIALAGLETFNKQCCALSEHWFGEEFQSEYDKELEAYILTGGQYGTPERKAAANSLRQGSRKQYVLKRIFPSFSSMKAVYPVLDKMPVLLPLMWIRRGVELISKGYLKQLMMEIEAALKVEESVLDYQRKILKKLGVNDIK